MNNGSTSTKHRIERGLPAQECMVTVRLSYAARDRLKSRAHEEGVTLNELCVRLLGLKEESSQPQQDTPTASPAK